MMNNTLIIGDSYSTFEGYIPEGYEIYYTIAGNPETDVRKVEETWWYQVFKEKGYNLVLNNSWSGSTIGYTGYDNEDCSKTSSFIYRLRQLIEKGFFEENQIDTVFVFGGTNDSWCKAPLGEMKEGAWEEKDFYSVLPAICYFTDLLRKTLPETKIYGLVNTGLNPEIESCLKEVYKKHRIHIIAFDQIEKTHGHPTIKGMTQIRDQVLASLE